MNARTLTLLAAPLCILSLAACGGPLEGSGDDEGIMIADETSGTDGDEDGAEDGDSESDTEGDSEGSACVDSPFRLQSVTPNIMLVLDKSGSMNDNTWDDDADSGTPEVTRWHSLHGVVSGLTQSEEQAMNFGLTLFPAIDAAYQSGNFDSSCRVSDTPEVGVGGSSSQILAAIPSADDESFGGATPATEGILTGLSHLEDLADGQPSAMVLVTDGAANCASQDDFISAYDQALEDAVRDAWEGAGVPTYVVGVDIGESDPSVEVNPREALDAVAQAGGVPSGGEVGFYDASDPAALETALDEISTRLGCQVELDFSPEPGLQFSVEVDGESIPQVDSCSDTSEAAWAQLDPINQPNRIELCNAACEGAEASGGVASMCPLIP